MEELLLLMKLLQKNEHLLKSLEEKELQANEKNELKVMEMTAEPSKHSIEHHSSEHFNIPYAKFIVSQMYHDCDGCKYVGEIYSMEQAEAVHEKYKNCIDENITCADMYVALNSQYHDYYELFKKWYTSDIDDKIVESAIMFWFKDEDYNKGFKLWNYFCN